MMDVITGLALLAIFLAGAVIVISVMSRINKIDDEGDEHENGV